MEHNEQPTDQTSGEQMQDTQIDVPGAEGDSENTEEYSNENTSKHDHEGFHLQHELVLLIVFALTLGGIVLTWRVLHAPATEPEPVEQLPSVTSFEECAQYYPVMESYPEQCATPDGKRFTREIGNELEILNMIQLESVRPGDTVVSPLLLEGQARGTYFFEGSFPVVLTDWDGRIIAEGFVSAEGEWMTEEFVPFSGELTFDVATSVSDRGSLILKKDNPSGLPEHDAALEIPVRFAGVSNDAEENPQTGILPADSGVTGSIVVGPQCPVMQEGEACPEAPHQTTVNVFRADGETRVMSIETDAEGLFTVDLYPGEYVLAPEGGEPFPTCGTESVEVFQGEYTESLIACDSGIR